MLSKVIVLTVLTLNYDVIIVNENEMAMKNREF
jgi:hypothetical protein